MKRSPKPVEQDQSPAAIQEPQTETATVRLRIEELESRLGPQSTAPILE